MSVDDQIRSTLDRTLSALRGHLEAELRTHTDELLNNAEQQHAAAAAQAAEALAEARALAEQELAEVRAAAGRDAEELRVSAEKQGEQTERQIAALRQQLDSTRAELEAVLTQSDRLADAVRALDEASSLGEVLDLLARFAAREAERIALMIVTGGKLQVRSMVGFGDAATQARKGMAVDDAGVVREALRSGVSATRSASAVDSLPSFALGTGPRHAAAFPIVVGGISVAVLYGDDSAQAQERRWLLTLDVLTRHASRVLEAMTVQHATGVRQQAVPTLS